MEKAVKVGASSEKGLAPTELLAEFLSSLMLKDYETAMGFCTQILIYEPNNFVAMEFHKLIAKKLAIMRNEVLENSSECSDSDSSYFASDSESFRDDDKYKSSSSESDLDLEKISDPQTSSLSKQSPNRKTLQP